MDLFELPAELPITSEELTELRGQATSAITAIQTRYDADEDLTSDDVASLNTLLDAVDTIDSAIETATAAETEHRSAVEAALARATAATTITELPAEVVADEVEAEDEIVVPEEVAVAAAAAPTPEPAAPVTFKGAGTVEADVTPVTPSWVVAHGAPGFGPEQVGTKVGFAEMGAALDTVRKGHGVGRLTGKQSGPKMRQELARMVRALPVVEDQHMLVNEIARATDQRNLPGGSLIAAGGWCAPSEQLYDFCDVPDATDLISLPEIAINRGGLRWPIEPDLTAIFESFEFFFTEPELEAVDEDGNPTAIKHAVEVPCPDEFEELRLNAIGYAVEAGILQRQGWPESIEWFLRSLTQEHFRALSRRTVRDMWNGGETVKVFDAALQVGGTSGILNSLALYATNLRLHRGLGRSATIEGVAPSWFHEVLRADIAMMEGLDTKFVTDGQIQSFLTARNLAFQFIGDWQTRGTGFPGNLNTMVWPSFVDVILYPAGTWFRSLSNIIEVGVMYPKEQLQVNRYTEFFTEDAIAVGKRCNVSANLRLPLKVNGVSGGYTVLGYSETAIDAAGTGFEGAS